MEHVMLGTRSTLSNCRLWFLFLFVDLGQLAGKCPLLLTSEGGMWASLEVRRLQARAIRILGRRVMASMFHHTRLVLLSRFSGSRRDLHGHVILSPCQLEPYYM